MILQDEATWPLEVNSFLSANHCLFDDWHGPVAEARERRRKPGEHSPQYFYSAREYDSAVYELRHILERYTLSNGYHCTRLTDEELINIRRIGMVLPDLSMLCARIRQLQDDGFLSEDVATRLIGTNQAKDKNRAGKIWFCFFAPSLAGESGISRFFRHWGGEALYNSHEDDPITSPILRRIGTPAVIRADVPIASLNPHSSLTTQIIRRYFVNRGWTTQEDLNCETFIVKPLPPTAILKVVTFPDPEFLTLTGCDSWRTKLIDPRPKSLS